MIHLERNAVNDDVIIKGDGGDYRWKFRYDGIRGTLDVKNDVYDYTRN